MKRLFEFSIEKEMEVEQIDVTKDEKGQEIKITRKVKQKVPQTFFIAKPNRHLIDEADFYYAKKLSEGIQAGLLTRQLLAKRYANDGGTMSEPEKENLVDLYVQLYEKEQEFKHLHSNKKLDELTKEEQQKNTKILEELEILRKEIIDFEIAHQSLFDQTAENRARTKAILWWIMFASFKDVNGKEEPVFANPQREKELRSYDDILSVRLDVHEEMIEAQDPFNLEVLTSFMHYISFWYVGRAQTKEEFEALEKQRQVDKEPKKEEAEKEAQPEPVLQT